MGMAHWVLNQVHGVLQREYGDANDERRRRLLWASMLKGWTTSERVRAQAKQQHLDTREELLER
jgi:hypothetical protein